MKYDQENPPIMTELDSKPNVPAIAERLSKMGFVPEASDRPKRCRAIIFSPDGTKILGIHRVKADRDPYTVYPGGGLEERDQTALDGLFRELDEELEIRPEDVSFTGSALRYEDQHFFVGWAKAEIEELHMSTSSPELTRDSYAGSYTPGWFSIENLASINLLPSEISSLVEEAAHN